MDFLRLLNSILCRRAIARLLAIALAFSAPALVRAQSPLTIKLDCTPTSPRYAFADLSWGRVAAAPAQLQITLYRRGFLSGMYAWFDVKSGDALVRHFAAASPAHDTTMAGLQLRAETMDTAGGLVRVRVSGLQHGLTYYWRVVPAPVAGKDTVFGITAPTPRCSLDQRK